MGFYDFNKDLLVSENTEKEISNILAQFGIKTIEFKKNNEYDIKVEKNNKILTAEVKEDFLTKETGNVAIEIESRGKPSGLSITKSNLYIYKIHEFDAIRFYIIKVTALKKDIVDNNYPIVVGGDVGSNTKMYLIPLGNIKKISFKIKEKYYGKDKKRK